MFLLDLDRALSHLVFQVTIKFVQFRILLLSEFKQAAVFQDQTTMIKGLPYRLKQFVIVPRFCQITVNLALVYRIDHRSHVRIARQQEPDGIRRQALGLLEELCTIHFRHALIGDDEGYWDIASFECFEEPRPRWLLS